MLSSSQFTKIYRASAKYDLAVTAAFATPWTFVFLMDLIGGIHVALNLPGEILQPDVFHIFFANLLGSVVIVWSIVRLKFNMLILARYDAVARYLFSAWMIYALVGGASWFLGGMLVIELGFGIAQSLAVRDK